jgi:CRP-like cAMP-binding protein
MLHKDGKIELLKQVPLFSRCNKKQLAAIATLADLIDMPAGKLLVREGSLGRDFMVIVDGAVDVSRQGHKINALGPGDFIGEMALISGAPRNATVTTTRPSSLLVVTERQFWDLLEQTPGMQMSVIKALGERLQSLAV